MEASAVEVTSVEAFISSISSMEASHESGESFHRSFHELPRKMQAVPEIERQSVCSSPVFALSQIYHTNSGTTDTILAQIQKQQCSSNKKRRRGSPLPYRRKATQRHLARQCKLRETTGMTSSSRKQHAAQLKLITKWNKKHTAGNRTRLAEESYE